MASWDWDAPHVHPDRPWWRRASGPTTGVVLPGWGVLPAGPVPGAWERTDGATLVEPKTPEEYDREHPLPVPAPQCGQVWEWPDGSQRMVGRVTHLRAYFSGGRYFYLEVGMGRVPVWPPSARLIRGPGAPWDYEASYPPEEE